MSIQFEPTTLDTLLNQCKGKEDVMIEEVKKRGTRVPYRMEDFQEDLKAL